MTFGTGINVGTKKGEDMYILNKGVKEINNKGFFKQLFCKHEAPITGEECSKNGLVRLNGATYITACPKCGKVLRTKEIYY